MTRVERVLALARVDANGALSFDDAAIERLLAIVAEHEGAALFDVARDFTRLAHFLDVEKKSPAASATLLTVVVALLPGLRAVDEGRAAALVAETEQAAERLKSFRGDERVTKVLETGARPAGTTPAGPLARFAVQVPKK